MLQSIENWAQRVCAGEVRALSQAITAIENHEPEAEELLRLLFPRTGKAYLTGVTGAPGTGKSTLVDRLSAHYRTRQEKVGVIAVDPTSPYSGGAGQDEIDIVRLADCVVVMLVPCMGVDIQNMKAGLMEIGDIFVLNKSDREGADRLEQQLNAMLSLVMPRDGWHPPVVRTVATESKGIEELAETVAKFRKHFESSGQRQKKHVEHWKNRLIELLESRLVERALGGAGGEARLAELAAEVADRKKDPFSAVNEILKKSGLHG